MEIYKNPEAEIAQGEFAEKTEAEQRKVFGDFFKTHPKSRQAVELVGLFMLMTKVIAGGELQAAVPKEEREKENNSFYTEQVEKIVDKSDSVFNKEIAPLFF